MSRSAAIRLFFGEGEFDFALTIGALEELDERFECGVSELMEHCAQIRAPVIHQVLRLGLIGKGMAKEQAFRLVQRHAGPGDLGSAAAVAAKVLAAVILGSKVEPLGENLGEATGEHLSPTDASGSPTTTAPVQP